MPDFSQESANKVDMLKGPTSLWRYKKMGSTWSCSWSLDTRGSIEMQKKRSGYLGPLQEK